MQAMSTVIDPAINTAEKIQVVPSGGPLAAEIRGLDLRHPLPPESAQVVRQALWDHCVIYFRGQQISEEQQVQFTRIFGTPVEHVRKQAERRVKEIFIISNVKENGEMIGALGNDEISFHSDLSYMPKPGTISMLYAVEVPATGGNTQWCNCYLAYETLDEELKQRIAGLRATHRHYIEEQNPRELVDHPIVRTHPQTGRKSLFVSPHFTKSILGISEAESADILARLFAHVVQPRFVWTHRWQVGDLLIWDNRPTMHRRESFPADQRRIMKRTQIFGDEIPV
jgi:taurine dioxygenase